VQSEKFRISTRYILACRLLLSAARRHAMTTIYSDMSLVAPSRKPQAPAPKSGATDFASLLDDASSASQSDVAAGDPLVSSPGFAVDDSGAADPLFDLGNDASAPSASPGAASLSYSQSAAGDAPRRLLDGLSV
jgi:hypothetical protein